MYFTAPLAQSFAALTAAHPGHEREESLKTLAQRDTWHGNKRVLDACSAKPEAFHQRGVELRLAEFNRQRIARCIAVYEIVGTFI
ncbi:putative Intradiol ring-cleavage dioxygenase [Seiridium cardinale]|uniref:Intradiol ring-cleavage dioxygenase n=1 Tax=Seiridium cardinale TaxID=138064 RepID=A0ABR2XGB1_9PEZI